MIRDLYGINLRTHRRLARGSAKATQLRAALRLIVIDAQARRAGVIRSEIEVGQ